MRIIYINEWLMLLSYFTIWPLLQLLAAAFINSLDERYFLPDNFFLRHRKWEDGLYRKLGIRKWKHLLPDGAAAYQKGFRKKKLQGTEEDYLRAFIIETGRAEVMHWLEMVPFFIFGFWSPFFVVYIMLGYALVVNIPCILTQRFNRPRLVRLYKGVSNNEI